MNDIYKYGFGTEGFFDGVKSLFSKKNKSININMTRDQFIKEANKFFLSKKNELDSILKKYSKVCKEYHIETIYDKYDPEYDRINLRVDFTKGLNFIEDRNSDAYKVSTLFGCNDYGTQTFIDKVKKEFKDKFNIDPEIDGDTDCVFIGTPDIAKITFSDSSNSGTESVYNDIAEDIESVLFIIRNNDIYSIDDYYNIGTESIFKSIGNGISKFLNYIKTLIVRFILWITGSGKQIKEAVRELEEEEKRLKAEAKRKKEELHKKEKGTYVYDIDNRADVSVSKEFMNRTDIVYFAPEIKTIDIICGCTKDIVKDLKDYISNIKDIKNWDQYMEITANKRIISEDLQNRLKVFSRISSASKVAEFKSPEEALDAIAKYKEKLKLTNRDLPDIQMQLKNIQNHLNRLGFDDVSDDILKVHSDLDHTKYQLNMLITDIKNVSSAYTAFISHINKAIDICIKKNNTTKQAGISSGSESSTILFNLDLTNDQLHTDTFDAIVDYIKTLSI